MRRYASSIERWEMVGWNGVRFWVPESWHPVGIERRCLMFERNGRPVMTLKWEPSKNHGSSRPGISRIRRGFPASVRDTVREIGTPDAWRRALGGNFERKDIDAAAAFSWGDPDHADGMGLLLNCRRSRQVFLLHFCRSSLAGDPEAPARMMASLGSGSRDGRVLWAVFDIRAEVPERLGLVRHRFMPGAYELRFGARGETVRLCRWGPASVLLRGESLEAFAAARFDVSRGAMAAGGPAWVQWRERRRPAWAVQRWIPLLFPPVFRQGRAWRIQDHDKILAVQIESRQRPDGNLLEALCGSFRCLSTDREGSGAPA